MSEPTDFRSVRWDRINGTRNFQPVEALDAAKRMLPELAPQHAMVILASEDDDGLIRFKVFQAGSFGSYAQRGLLAEVAEGWNG